MLPYKSFLVLDSTLKKKELHFFLFPHHHHHHHFYHLTEKMCRSRNGKKIKDGACQTKGG